MDDRCVQLTAEEAFELLLRCLEGEPPRTDALVSGIEKLAAALEPSAASRALAELT